MGRGAAHFAVLALAALVACSSDDAPNDGATDASVDARIPQFRFHVDPTLVVLEAGGSTKVSVTIDQLPGGIFLTQNVSFEVEGLPEGVRASNLTNVHRAMVHDITLEGSRDCEGLASVVRLVPKLEDGTYAAELIGSEASFELRTITKKAPVLDDAFGGGGRVSTGGGLARDEVRGAVVQADGKLIVAGGYNTGYTRIPAVARYALDGKLDATFGSGGVALLPEHDDSLAAAVALQADGKVLVLEPAGLAVTRLTSSGAIDTTYGTGGTAFAFFGVDAFGAAFVVQSDGKVVAAGRALNAMGDDLALVRYTTTGALDTTFGGGGTGRLSRSIVDGNDGAIALALDGTSGALFAAATATTAAGKTQVAVAKYDTNGVLDASFDGDGIALYSSTATADDVATTIALSGTSVLVAGTLRDAPATDRGFVLRYAANGVLDPTFDADGVRPVDLGGEAAIESLVVQPSGALLLGGAMRTAAAAPGKIALTRLLADGTTDTSFGGGVVTTTSGDASSVRKLVVRPDGKIVAVGTSRTARNPDIALAVYSDAGVLDASFGDLGVGVSTFGPGDDGIRAIALGKDGKLVAAGYAYNGTDFDFLVARFIADGRLDPSFGGGTGRVFFDRPGTSQFAYGVNILDDQRIVVSGQGGPGTIVIRLQENGALDDTFGTQGATVLTGGDSFGLAVQNDGKVVVAGAATGQGFFVSRLSATGAPDGAFGQGGSVTTLFDEAARGIAFALDPSGKVIVVGHIDFRKPPNFFDLALARFDTNGNLDPSFGGGGKTTVNNSDVELYYATALQKDGKVLVAGRSAQPAKGSSLGVFRLGDNGTLDGSFGDKGRATIDVGEGSQASAMVLQPNGTILIAGRTPDDSAAIALLSAKGATVWPGGFVKEKMGLGGEAFAVASGLDGRFFVAGFARVGSHEDGVVLRYRR